ncbi:chorismate mutase [Lentilactobacillus kisonensis]|uniref:Chorismate mutase n=2 Tax=Lentilactobacillus kisonensis TaxID=481722 RepID=H1LFA9_9LACO|nr:chorismate mutase [Lentilactobacillus kisonensis]EHO51859.1 chorismate mutase [Lentilactobacillus kisonensis F0435]KRL22415.1 chorismate mutase [Lentilactobacillus kisonensis DSM 19906 = JCM 15041]
MNHKGKASVMAGNEEINAAREQINHLDESIVRLLVQRFQTAALIGQIKDRDNLPVLDNSREQVVLNRVRTLDPDSHNGDYIENVYREILKNSRAYQHALIKANNN